MDWTALILACAPLVHPVTAAALVRTESAFNPNAIHVNGGELERQPRSAAEAIATARALMRDGWDFDAGLAQINRRNFARLGLAPETVFDPCTNLRAMQAVLTECFRRAGTGARPQLELRRALSCYQSGNFATGFDQGYVDRVVRNATR